VILEALVVDHFPNRIYIESTLISSPKPMNKKPARLDLGTIFGSLQNKLLSELKVSKSSISHPGTQGSVTESRWRAMLSEHLPVRYCATQAFVVDSKGAISEQIDVVIYDRQYSPFIVNQDDAKFITAESVYGVFEIKPTTNASTLDYASKKIASVRKLHRTSAPIPHAGGVYKPKPLTPIIGGLLSVDDGWRTNGPVKIRQKLTSYDATHRLELGCILKGLSYEAEYESDKIRTFTTASKADKSLVFFLLRLLARLQELGTVAAVDLRAYSKDL